jgi:hypothetical protein
MQHEERAHEMLNQLEDAIDEEDAVDPGLFGLAERIREQEDDGGRLDQRERELRRWERADPDVARPHAPGQDLRG